jgi:hypothetical protein
MPSFDPRDREILERAFDAARAAVKNNDPSAEFDSDERLGGAAPRACRDRLFQWGRRSGNPTRPCLSAPLKAPLGCVSL